MCIRDSLWIARRLTEPDGQFVAATFEKWNYTAYYWLPDPTNKLDWQDGARFYVRVMERSTWATFLEQISSFIGSKCSPGLKLSHSLKATYPNIQPNSR